MVTLYSRPGVRWRSVRFVAVLSNVSFLSRPAEEQEASKVT